MRPLTLRNILQALFLLSWSVVWISIAFVATLLTFNRNTALVLARRCWAPGLLWGAQADFRVEPNPNIDWKTPHIYAMNHQSMLDIVCAFAGLPVNIRFVAKHSLAYVPFLGWYMWLTGMVFINRSNRFKAVESLKLAGKRIREGANIIAYPEGTRTVDGKVQPFKKGPFVLAIEAGVPIVPVAIEGSHQALPTGGFRLRPRVIRMKLGAPIPTVGRAPGERDALLREVRDAIIQLNLELGGCGGDANAVAAAGQEGNAPALVPSQR